MPKAKEGINPECFRYFEIRIFLLYLIDPIDVGA
jgi:hypothetical protein